MVDRINESSGSSLQFRWASSSSTISGGVWNSLGGVLTDLSDVVHGFFLPSSTASGAVFVARDNLLLREIVKLSSVLNFQLRFNGRSSGESPAGTTLSLVLNWVDCTLGSPVDGRWSISNWKNSWLWSSIVLWSFVSEKFFVLVLGPGGEEVVSNSESVCWVSVDSLVLSIFLEEDLFSELIFSNGSVGKTVLSDVLLEVLVEGLLKTEKVKGFEHYLI